MINIHNLETFTADDPDLGPSSILVLKGFEGGEDIQDFLSEMYEPRQPADSETWRASVVCRFTGLSETTIRKKVLKGEFPAPIDLGERSKGWVSHEVIAWRKARPRRWVGELRKPVALRKNKPKLSTIQRGANAVAPVAPTTPSPSQAMTP